MLTNPAVQAEFGTGTPQAGHCTRPPGPCLRSEHRYCALLKALLPGERSSPAHLGSYKAWRASTAAKQIRIEAGPSFIHERSGAAGGSTKLKLDPGNRSLANASGSERSWPSASLTSRHSYGARSVSEGAIPVSEPCSQGGAALRAPRPSASFLHQRSGAVTRYLEVTSRSRRRAPGCGPPACDWR